MVLGFVRTSIAELIKEDNPKKIELDFSFTNNSKMDEEMFYTLLEVIEEEVQVNLVDVAWKFETLKQLVDYINNHK